MRHIAARIVNVFVPMRSGFLSLGGDGSHLSSDGDEPDMREIELMVSEKLDAMTETVAEIAAGHTVLAITQHYRERVAANAVRLRAA